MSFLIRFVFLCVILTSMVPHKVNGQLSPGDRQDILDMIRQEWEDKKDEIINDIDFGYEFEQITGITIGGVIAILLVIILIPNLVITLLIFAFCYCCGYIGGNRNNKGGSGANVYYNQPPTATSNFAPVPVKPMGPAVPPKPHTTHALQSPPPQAPAPSSGMWPWGKDDDNQYGGGGNAYNQNQQRPGGMQNPAYNDKW